MKPFLARRIAAVIMGVAGLGATMAIAPTAAHAAGSYNGAVFQVTFALNCNHPGAPCAQIFGYGGIWGWEALVPTTPTVPDTVQSGNSNAQVTECGHQIPNSPGVTFGPTGAGHANYDGQWVEAGPMPDPSPITPKDPNNMYLFFVDATSSNLGIPPMPATYGHYPVNFAGAEGQETIAP